MSSTTENYTGTVIVDFSGEPTLLFDNDIPEMTKNEYDAGIEWSRGDTIALTDEQKNTIGKNKAAPCKIRHTIDGFGDTYFTVELLPDNRDSASGGVKQKCRCGSTAMHTYVGHDCFGCSYNGFSLSDEECEILDIDNKYVHYDDELLERAQETLKRDVYRTEAEDNGECMIGQAYDGGCIRVVCATCGAHVTHIPFVEAC